jgi:radical SAM protein with 4Fe4S-binding SPASM domain
MNIKYLTYRKIKLLSLLWISYQASALFKRNFRWGRYISISVEPTNSCNLSCIECPTGTNNLTRKTGLFSIDAFKNVLNEKAKDLIYLNFYFQGEPFLNKQTVEMIRLASKRNIYTSTSTNAQLIDKDLAENIIKSGLNRLIISIDGTTQKVYEQYRQGGKLDLVIEATKLLVETKAKYKSSLRIVFQFLVFKHNQHQIEDIKKLAKKLKVDKLEIKTAQIYKFENSNNIPSIDKYSRYKLDKTGQYKIKSKLPNKCWRMWHSVVITQDLKLVPCCYDKDAQFELGNLEQNTIAEIEKNTRYKKFRQNISDGRSNILICKNCSEGLQL